MMEEQRLRTLKWDISAPPRAELVNQLKDQMSAASLNRQLMVNMFHQDFKFHLKALEALYDDFDCNMDSAIANLDLILRWITIRLYDTNTSVNIKCMEYLCTVFSALSDNKINIQDYEAYSFMPTLVMKVN